jgi:lipopolysaccharide/colanic/teichoic acid biosynthesis glycosyltransferase
VLLEGGLADLPAIYSGSPAQGHRARYFFCKRILDTALAFVLLILLSPLLALIALAIKLESPGPVIFVQQRVSTRRRSRGGTVIWEIRSFPVYKFRSMVHNADPTPHRAYIKALAAGYIPAGASQKQFKLSRDPRITRVGRLLRRTSLDELPQLLNVLKGEMSLVGPRPVPLYEVAQYKDWHYQRLTALPGLTGLWQVKGRGRVSFDEMIRLDLEYIVNQSLWFDLQILLLTIPAVLSGHGAA